MNQVSLSLDGIYTSTIVVPQTSQDTRMTTYSLGHGEDTGLKMVLERQSNTRAKNMVKVGAGLLASFGR